MSTGRGPTGRSALPDRYEVVDGEVVELPCPSGYASEVANRIRNNLQLYGSTSGLGRSRSAMLFRIPLPTDPERSRFPSVSFTTYHRWPEGRPLPYRGNPVDVVPDLMVEVASPTDQADELVAKAHEYLEAGVRLVWLVYPRSWVVHAYESPTAVRVFTTDMDLDGGAVLPGFRVPVAALFPPLAGLLPVEDDAEP
jgi:Uma2 family endonuclease